MGDVIPLEREVHLQVAALLKVGIEVHPSRAISRHRRDDVARFRTRQGTLDGFRRALLTRLVLLQGTPPLLQEEPAVALGDEAAETGATARAVVMTEALARLVEHELAVPADRHGEVDVHEVGRIEPLLEPAHGVPGGGAHQQRAGAGVVHRPWAVER